MYKGNELKEEYMKYLEGKSWDMDTLWDWLTRKINSVSVPAETLVIKFWHDGVKRQIKFRVWDKNKFRMFYGWNLACDKTGNFSGGWYGDYLEDDDNDGMDYAGDNWLYLDKSNFELMQFVGETSKNGKEIYEGDIVKIDGYDKPYPIVYYKNGFYINDGIYSNWDANEIEIIGNIYENPELVPKSL